MALVQVSEQPVLPPVPTDMFRLPQWSIDVTRALIEVLRAVARMLNSLADTHSMRRQTVASTAPGANIGMFRWEPGTLAGTLKLVGYAGTSTTGITIVDNVGAGNG